MSTFAQLSALLDIGLAALLGAVLGLERERAGKPAGLRTHILVAIATAVFVTVGNTFIVRAVPPMAPDPMKLLEAIVTGISFLGAGTIVFRRRQGVVEGLTTAASLLLVGAVSVAVCVDLKLLAVGVTLFALSLVWSLTYVESAIAKRREQTGEAQAQRAAARDDAAAGEDGELNALHTGAR